MAEHPNFWEDIYPLFTDGDVACMRALDVLLASYEWWTTKDGDTYPNFEAAYEEVESGRMPMGGPRWDPESVKKLADWKANGFPEGPRPTD
jgi:hypothetical protein